MQISLQQVNPLHIEPAKIAGSALWNEDITIRYGEHLHIVAPSGTGKTTLMHFMYGLRSDYEGKIIYNGMDLKTCNAEDLAKYRKEEVSIIFQDLRLFDGQTVRENIEIKRRLNPYHGAPEVDQMCERLGIGNKMDQPAGTCSYGEQQRIAIIRALMQPFRFLLLDEPYSHLDEDNRKKAMELIYEECEKRNAAMVFADLKPLELLIDERVLML